MIFSVMGLNMVLECLNWLMLLFKELVVNVCVDCILYDKKVVIKEIELLRVVCVVLDCLMFLVLEYY